MVIGAEINGMKEARKEGEKERKKKKKKERSILKSRFTREHGMRRIYFELQFPFLDTHSYNFQN